MNETQKIAIIVGASSGIGLATAKLMIKNGFKAYGVSRTLPPEDSGITGIIADAANHGSLKDAIEFVASEEQTIDALIYSAGFSMAAPIEFAQPKDYRYLFDVNLFGILESMQAAIPYMKNSGGRIVLVSSMAGTFAVAFDSFYSASKAAVDMLARAADIELRPYNIRVTSIKPGGVNTRFTFKRKAYAAKNIGDYAQRQEEAVSSLAAAEQGGMDAEKVASDIYSIINSQNPPVITATGLKNKAYMAAAKILPGRLIQFVNESSFDN